jgi:hypothetical protein
VGQECKVGRLRIADTGGFGQCDQQLHAFAASAVDFPAPGHGFDAIANARQALRIFDCQRIAHQFGQECGLSGGLKGVLVAHYKAYRDKQARVEKKVC